MTAFENDRGPGGDRGGLALVATLIVLAVVGVLVAAATRATLTTLRTSSLDYHEARAFYAAEAGAEAALSELLNALYDGYLSDEEVSGIRPPDLEGFSYDSFSVSKMGASGVETITDGAYAGLYALTQNVDVYSMAADRNATVSGVVLRAKGQTIPIFQFGVFYSGDLEITNVPPLEFAGRVHSNGRIYLCSPAAWYRDMITTPRQVVLNRKDFNYDCPGVYINDAAGDEVRLDFDSRDTPDPERFKAKSVDHFDARLQTAAFEVRELRVPLPGGIDFYEVIRPREGGDSEQERRVKYAWKADLYIDPSLPAIAANTKVCDQVASAKSKIPQCDDAVEFIWEAFYDARERRYVDVLDIDVSLLPPDVRIIYVAFTPPFTGSDDSADGVYPALRVKNAAELPGPLTVVSNHAVYVWGDFNSIDKKPASLAGDAVTILSNAWVDDRHVCYEPGGGSFGCSGWGAGRASDYRSPAASTVVNGAILAGHVPTPCDWAESDCIADGSQNYYENWFSGGLENFPRMLEHWGGQTLTYLGSLASLYSSRVAVGTWNEDIYRPPSRNWAFDTDFRDPAKLPPGTPVVGNVIRTAMREAF